MPCDCFKIGEQTLKLWIHGRQFPKSIDYWDGNWLQVTAYCCYPYSIVCTHGTIVHLGDISALLKGCESLYQTLEGEAGLNCLEPNLTVKLSAMTGGKIKLKISITPDCMKESHNYNDSLDQTYLPPIISACQTILETYPIRAAETLPK